MSSCAYSKVIFSGNGLDFLLKNAFCVLNVSVFKVLSVKKFLDLKFFVFNNC